MTKTWQWYRWVGLEGWDESGDGLRLVYGRGMLLVGVRIGREVHHLLRARVRHRLIDWDPDREAVLGATPTRAWGRHPHPHPQRNRRRMTKRKRKKKVIIKMIRHPSWILVRRSRVHLLISVLLYNTSIQIPVMVLLIFTNPSTTGYSPRTIVRLNRRL